MNKSEAIKEYEAAAAAPRWFVVNTSVHAERVAKAHIERSGVEVYLPVRFAAKKAKTAVTPFFPGYLFVKPDLASPKWNSIYTAVGVRAVLGNGGRPMAAPFRLIESLRKHELDGVVQVKSKRPKPITFRSGDKVKVKAGPFIDFEGLFECGDQTRIIVLLSLFGGHRPVELNVDDIMLAD